jgi:cell cycle checkpoint protein
MSLNEVWEAASATPFTPLVDKDSQFSVGFNLLLIGKLRGLRSFDNRLLTILIALVTTTLFGLSKYSFSSLLSFELPLT